MRKPLIAALSAVAVIGAILSPAAATAATTVPPAAVTGTHTGTLTQPVS